MPQSERGPWRIAVRVPATRPLREVIATARRAESAGFDGAWFPDSHLNYREVWTTLGAVAAATDRIAIAPTVTNVLTRHLTVTASAARTVAEVAPGRFFVGLGSGDSAVGFDGLRPAAPAALRAGVEALRTLWRGQAVRYGGFEAVLRGAAVDVPVYLAGSGPRVLELAGEVADGVILFMGNLEHKLSRVRAGAARAGRAPPPCHVYTSCAIVDDIGRVSRMMKSGCLRVAQLEGTAEFERAGIRLQVPPHRAGADGDWGHAADLDAASRRLDHIVSDEAAAWYAANRTLVGTARDIAARVMQLRALGIAGVTVSALSGTDLPDALVESVAPLLPELRR
ncbi:MAG: LLM class flavin-dependent oxidoreductase [Gammaproteobacteria bacterium]